MSTRTLFCIVRDLKQADTIADNLQAAGFSNDDISVVLADSLARDGAVVGSATGGLMGGALGWLAGAGLAAIPTAAAFVAAGPILALLTGAILGASAGGLVGGLIGTGIPEFHAKEY